MYKWFIHFKYLSSVGAMNMNMPGHVSRLGCSWFCNHNSEHFFVLTDAPAECTVRVLPMLCYLWWSLKQCQLIAIRHFQIAMTSVSKQVLVCNLSYGNAFYYHIHCLPNQTHLHMKGCAPGLALIKGAKGNWGMACYCRHSCTPWKLSKPFWLIIGK